MMNVRVGEDIILKIYEYSFEIPINDNIVQLISVYDNFEFKELDLTLIPIDFSNNKIIIKNVVQKPHSYLLTFESNTEKTKNKKFKIEIKGYT